MSDAIWFKIIFAIVLKTVKVEQKGNCWGLWENSKFEIQSLQADSPSEIIDI